MTDNITQLNAELDVFRCEGGLFDVEPSEMDLNIGRRCKFNTPASESARKSLGTLAMEDTFTVATVQRNYAGQLCYRVVGDRDVHRFGRVVAAEEIHFID